MSNKASRDIAAGRFIVGRTSGIAFNAVEGLRESSRVAGLREAADQAGETGEARRERIRAALKAKPRS